ncbi:TadE/TadG family type IV pilus assembly protein [Kitasatospora acidiphila]|uniref:TadE/TadG family type IV pilus assembly protein n=1 Tax=Kitasatospora acidiphila TaxID=2567942 RepID=UPI0015F05491|nr:TadE/TadG family type IV pilus assembly protein [Kitasatospora acidiphila]
MLSISFAMVFPIIIVLVMLVVQGALIWYSDSVALAAAREGADAARVYGTKDNSLAQPRAELFLQRFNGLLGDTVVTVPKRQPGDTVVTVTVTVHPLFVLPGELTFSQTAQAPIERYQP